MLAPWLNLPTTSSPLPLLCALKRKSTRTRPSSSRRNLLASARNSFQGLRFSLQPAAIPARAAPAALGRPIGDDLLDLRIGTADRAESPRSHGAQIARTIS